MPTNFQKAKRRTKLANGNWSDPISYATSSESVEMTDGTNLQTAMGNKVDKETGKGLSSNDYTNADKTAVLSLGTASKKDVNTSGNASASQVVMGNDTRLTDSRPASDVSAWAKAASKPTYTKAEIGLSNVDNTSDANKPVSTATQTALDGKVDKVNGKGLSTNDYTTSDKNKLAEIEAEANKTIVDSAMSDSSTNPLQNKVITKELEGAKTTSGNPITVTDAAPVNAVNLSMDLEPVQDLHGYDHPWVGGAGKNLLPMTVEGIKALNTSSTWSGNNYTLNGITFTIQTDSNNNVIGIKINGTKNGDSAIFNLANYTASSGDKLNGCNDTTSNTYYIYARGGNSVCRNSDVTISNNDVGVARLYAIAVVNNTTISNAIVYPMIRLSTETDSSFAPYTNICPISGRSEVAIQRVSENLINIPSSWDAYEISDGVYKGGFNNFRTKFYIPSTAVGKELTASVDLVSYGIYNARIVANVGGTNISGNGIEANASGTSTVTFTPQSTSDYITLDYSSNLSDVKLSHYFLTEFSKTYTIQIGQTVYKARAYPTKGYAELIGAEADLGSLTWTKRTVNNYTIFLSDNTLSKKNNILCSCYKAVVKGRDNLNNGEIGTWNTSNSFECVVRDDTKADLTEAQFKTAVTGQTLVYELATPYTIQLTPQQIKLLENNNTISTDYEGDTITIEYQPNNAIGEAVRAVEENYETRVSLLESRNTAKVYGFHISSTESDPAAKVTYLADAVGMTPAKMNYSKGKFDYGSWEDVWFVRDTKPCLLKDNGQIHRYLNKNNFLKDIDGNDTGVPQITIHTMIEFPKIWYKVVPDIDGKGASIYISPVKVDADYVDYPYINYQGVHKEHFYMPAYNGSTQTESGTTYLCSTYGETVSKSLTAEQEIAYCKAHGNGWNTEDAGSIMLINFLLILMGKSTDVQSVFGQGLHTSGTGAINNGFTTGIHYNKGMFYGTNSGTIASNSYSNAVKVFGIENYWGFQWRRYAGDILVNGVRKIKLCYGNEDGSSTFDYNLTGNGYVNVGATPSGTSGGYISEMKFTKNGMYSKVSSGSSSTHYCDGQWYNNSGTRYAVRGGDSTYGAPVGAFCVALDDTASRAWWSFGAAPSYR